jgi:Mg2+ and Co2+ transporter CorA
VNLLLLWLSPLGTVVSRLGAELLLTGPDYDLEKHIGDLVDHVAALKVCIYGFIHTHTHTCGYTYTHTHVQLHAGIDTHTINTHRNKRNKKRKQFPSFFSFLLPPFLSYHPQHTHTLHTHTHTHTHTTQEQTNSMIGWAKSLNDEYLNEQQYKMNEVMYLLTMVIYPSFCVFLCVFCERES